MEEPSVQQTLRSHGLFSTSSYEARPMAELRALASDFDVPHDLATSWQALGMRLALDEAVTIARAANPEQVLRLMGAHDVCVRASWLCRQDRLSLWGLRGKLPPEAIVSVEDLFHVHKRFGTETLPLVAMREMFVSGEEEELASGLVMRLIDALNALAPKLHHRTHWGAGPIGIMYSGGVVGRRSGAGDVAILMPSRQLELHPPKDVLDALTATPAAGMTGRRLTTRLRKLCGEFLLPWSIADDAASLARRIADAMEEATTRTEREDEVKDLKRRSGDAALAEYLLNEARVAKTAREAAAQHERRATRRSPSSPFPLQTSAATTPQGASLSSTPRGGPLSSTASSPRAPVGGTKKSVTIHLPQVVDIQNTNVKVASVG